MRILVMGAGAVGSAFGGFLRLAGHELTLVGREPHIDAIRRGGLRIRGLWGDHNAQGFELLTDAAALRGPFDVVLVCVKSFDTTESARQVRHVLAPHTLLVSLQNGIGNVEALHAATAHRRVLGGRVIFGIVRPAPGAIEITVYTQPVMSGYPGDSPAVDDPDAIAAARRLAAAVDAAGIPCRYTERIESYLWAKLLYNCALNPLSAIHRVPYGALAEDARLRRTMDAVIDEIMAVAVARGIDLPWTAQGFCELFYGKLVPDTFHHRSSMLQDIERGRPTEIDALCGRVVAYGREAGIATPVNAALLEQVKRLGA